MKKAFLATILVAFFIPAVHAAEPMKIGDLCRKYAKHAEGVMLVRQYLPFNQFMSMRADLSPSFHTQFDRARDIPVFSTPPGKDRAVLLFGLQAYDYCIFGQIDSRYPQ